MPKQTLSENDKYRMTHITGKNKLFGHLILVSGALIAGYAVYQRGGAYTAYDVGKKLLAVALEILSRLGS